MAEAVATVPSAAMELYGLVSDKVVRIFPMYKPWSNGHLEGVPRPDL